MELGTIRQINIDTEMQASYLDYAMSVIVARALPDVRDGLKPVHRRILYAMHDLGLDHDKPYKKSARIVGEVLGKYHPHGDAAVYEAMVRMAQDFSLRYPLVDGQGNFGSIDGDNAAAMRYTEARLAAISTEMLADLEKETVDWSDNFDGTLKEPAVLPSALPNLLVNGSSGIAVGMSTNVPPHNLGEVCDALSYLIDNYKRADDVTVEDLMQFIQGPDFPTGGVVYRYQQVEDPRQGEGSGADREKSKIPVSRSSPSGEGVDTIARAYASGKGHIVVQAKAHIEEMSGSTGSPRRRSRSRIVVTELPYQTDKTRLLERIAELVRDGRIEGITDLRDESDRAGMRVCIEMTRTVDPKEVLADLFRLTPMQSTFSVSLLALVDGEPRLLSLKRLLLYYIEHRQNVIVRRSQHDLERAKQRAHILEGLLRALDLLDQIIALIRGSKSADDARKGLIKQFKFTELQAQAILDMQLRRLAALERRKLAEEHKETLALIRELEALLKSPKKVLALIKQNLAELKARHADPRRTQITDRAPGTLTAHDLLPDEDVWVALGADGLLKRYPAASPSVYPFLSVASLLRANTRDDLYLFSAKGQATRVPVHQIPEAPGAHFADLSGFARRDRVVAMCPLPKPDDETPASGFQLLGTTQGKVKRVALADPSTGSGQGLLDQAATNPQVIGLDEGDELLWASVSNGSSEIMLVTAQGQSIRFSEEEVRPTGLPAGGVSGIKLAEKDRVVAGLCIAQSAGPSASQPFHLAIVTTAGYAKRALLADFSAQGRYGVGLIAINVSARSGEVAGAALCQPTDTLVFRMEGGKSRALPASALVEQGRSTLGKFLAELAVGTPVTGVYAFSEVKELAPVVGAIPSRSPVPEPAPKPARGKANDVAVPKSSAKSSVGKAKPAPATDKS
jgi:DNA gyrase subunit A